MVIGGRLFRFAKVAIRRGLESRNSGFDKRRGLASRVPFVPPSANRGTSRLHPGKCRHVAKRSVWVF